VAINQEDQMGARIAGAALAIFAAWSYGAGAMAAQPNELVRGTIDAVSGGSLAIKSYGENIVHMKLESGTKVAWVVPSSLSDIKSGDFIGDAATGPENRLVALEVVIFPDAMRGTGEGHYPWSMPAAVAEADAHGGGASSGASVVHGTMTNGTVTGAARGGSSVKGTMTNGTVATENSEAGGRQLTVSFNQGKKVEMRVPPGVPVVRFVPAQRADLASGEKAFVVATNPGNGSEPNAKFVAVGKNGLMPPM
jgi:hypothetical protein